MKKPQDQKNYDCEAEADADRKREGGGNSNRAGPTTFLISLCYTFKPEINVITLANHQIA